jgi:hypothetical protein
MAKLNRNRGMFFGSWTGQPVEESASAQVLGTSSATVSVTAGTFGKAVNGVSGEYVFQYDGTNWTYNGTVITLTTYGLTISGSPAEGDSVTVSYTGASSGWEALGKDNDDLSKELNPDTETGKNVLGETTFTHSGYEPEVDLDPYYMDPSRNMYAHLLDIALQEKYGEADCIGYFAEAFFTAANEETKTMTGYCYVRQAWFVPQSTGGDTAGYNIPYNIHPIGAMTKKAISYNMTTNEATITDLTNG